MIESYDREPNKKPADYNFTRFRLGECVEEVIREFLSLAEEMNICEEIKYRNSRFGQKGSCLYDFTDV